MLRFKQLRLDMTIEAIRRARHLAPGRGADGGYLHDLARALAHALGQVDFDRLARADLFGLALLCAARALASFFLWASAVGVARSPASNTIATTTIR